MLFWRCGANGAWLLGETAGWDIGGEELETGSQGKCGLFFLTDNTRGAHSLTGLRLPGRVSSKLCGLG